MDERTRELVAIAASVAGRCQPCFRHHLERSRELGVSDEDIRSTIALASRISEVGDQRMVEFVESLMKGGMEG
ncbi:MAG: carboxymuconolactone decarboxylase family protein [Methanomassiliicoccales archaeon]|nr:MAG: carboxymuconolactone decarboxylase family protein [Methanomassiliicoccales archaeon]